MFESFNRYLNDLTPWGKEWQWALSLLSSMPSVALQADIVSFNAMISAENEKVLVGQNPSYTLGNLYITMENHHVDGKIHYFYGKFP